jgi:hypothetical protein
MPGAGSVLGCVLERSVTLMGHHLRVLGAAALVLPILTSACGDEDPAEATGTVVIQFDNVVDGAPLALNQMIYTNPAGNTYSVGLLEYVVSDVTLHGAEAALRHGDGDVTHVEPHYRSHANDATRGLTLEGVHVGSYGELHFRFGIVGADNVSGAFPDLDQEGMAWPSGMGGGYHYMRSEGNWSDTPSASSGAYATHTGPTMGVDYSLEVIVDLPDFTLEEGTTKTIRLNMDLNKWYGGPTIYNFVDYGPIMDNVGAQQILQSNGADVWSVAEIS